MLLWVWQPLPFYQRSCGYQNKFLSSGWLLIGESREDSKSREDTLTQAITHFLPYFLPPVSNLAMQHMVSRGVRVCSVWKVKWGGYPTYAALETSPFMLSWESSDVASLRSPHTCKWPLPVLYFINKHFINISVQQTRSEWNCSFGLPFPQ